MAKKTWKLGEVCKGGIITVETNGQDVAVIGKDWDFSAGSNKGSNQSNAKEWTRFEKSADDSDFYKAVSWFINDLTSYYYTDKIMGWIESNVDTNKDSTFNW